MPNTIPEFPEGTRYFIWVEGRRAFNDYHHVVIPPRGESKTYRGGRKSSATEYTRDYILLEVHSGNFGAQNWQEVTREGFLQAQLDPASPPQNLSAYVRYFTGRLPPPPPPPPRTFYKIGVPKNKLP